ncbi:MAG: membrane protein insertion efficiency factor YidD [Bacteroidetes bacterium]|nr:membrane protein insertion efficiency factor YidD [Bacteroidota bacterium]
MHTADSKTAQSSNDFQLISNHQRKNPYPPKRKASYLFADKKKIVKYNPVSLLFGGMLFTYQAVISSQIAADCPYEVSCSAFSKLSIQEFGLIKGLALSADRLTRCTKSSVKHIHPLRLSENGNIIDFPSYYRIKSTIPNEIKIFISFDWFFNSFHVLSARR